MKLFSLFSGIGGLEFGLRDKVDLIGYSEIKESSVKIFDKWYEGKNYGDIKKINFNDLLDFDILVGGFPCQSFSLAGLRKGFEDERGKMIFYIYELLKIKKPEFVVLENVKGILSHNKGKTYKDIVKLLSSLGYFVRIILLNALNYGSAQNRERIFFLCSNKDFEVKNPIKIDDSKRFGNFLDKNRNNYRFIKKNNLRILDKIEQKRLFNFELIGKYDRIGTLTTQKGCGEKLVWDEKEKWYRYLTILECERLQGFSDGWTDGISEKDRYFALGNAVNCNMSKYLFEDYLPKIWKI